MPLTNKEKQNRYVQRVKASGQYEEHKKKRAAAVKKCREKNKHCQSLLSKHMRSQLDRERKEATRKRVAKYRKLKRERASASTSQGVSEPFRSAQAFAKAAARARRMMNMALPNSPKRRKAVCRKLYEKENKEGKQSTSTMPQETSRPHPLGLSTESVKAVQAFYERDDISRQAPGRKDVVTIWEMEGKRKMQAKHLTSSIKETHALFCLEKPELHVGKSKFAELRPKHVLLSRKLPHNVCLCRYHENAINAINALHSAHPGFPIYSHDLPVSFLCKQPSRKCWMNECPECENAAGFNKAYNFDDSLHIPCTWHVWQMDDDSRMMKIEEEGTVEELVEYICAILPKFLEHCYVKREQAAAYQTQREKAASESHDAKTALLQVDFSENYTCVSQDEVQSAHWNQRQVSLFTASLWYSGSSQSRVVASDNLTHSKDTILAYMDVLLEELPNSVTFLSVWSDGPASQFKNRFIASGIAALQEKHNIEIQWNFFYTSHGKGPVDGIGGSLKHHVWSKVLSRKCLVKDAESFVAAASGMRNVIVQEMKPKEITVRNEGLHVSAVFTQAKAISGIAKMHFLKVVNDNVVPHILTKDNINIDDECFG